jgi:hypothetical protein
MGTTSIPNCLKQSDSTRRAGSFMSTRATRAVDFLVEGMLAMALALALALSGAYLMVLGRIIVARSGMRRQSV